MIIRRLELFDFRNYTHQVLDFTAPSVLIYGENGKGKTNILEALFLLGVGKGWRDKTNRDLIREGEESALIRCTTNTGDIYEIQCKDRSKIFLRNEKKSTLKDYFGNIPVVLFVPEYLHMFRGAKSERVRFFDQFFFQLDENYRLQLGRAAKAVKQKNSLLKNEDVRPEDIHPWNQILSETIPQVHQMRRKHIDRLNPILQKKLAEIARNDDIIDLDIMLAEDYLPTTQGVQAWCQQNMAREIAARRSFLGPQRDDFVFSYRNRPLGATASRGEERSILLALLSAQKEIYTQDLGKSPILLLDDVFSELDQTRQNHLEHLCDTDSQVFFTTTHKDHFQNFGGDIQTIEITDDFFQDSP